MLYRVRQFFRALLARVDPGERALVAQVLSPAQAALFGQMARGDQRHGLDVFHALRAAGHDDRALLEAALLHDVGKTAVGLTLLHRVVVVLLDAAAPSLIGRLAGDGKGWRAPFAAHVRHAEIGASKALSAGCSPETAALIRRHHAPAHDDRRLAALQRADREH
ncbi:MAG: hypothetical protein JXA09_04340 [Anaerolineae bacterium]|nr:hypothetical protein [Anaerolineae bacterium]